MDISFLFTGLPKGYKLYSPLFSFVTFNGIRKYNPMDENSPNIIECKTLQGNIVMFNSEGKPLVWQPTGEMMYETNLGETMLFLDEMKTPWETIIEKIKSLAH